MYLREMGTVPLLTREGEVEIAKRIERGKLAVIKSISRTPTIAKHDHAAGRPAARTASARIRELVIFNDEEITDEQIDDRKQQVQQQIDAVRKALARSPRSCKEKLDEDAEGRDDARQAEVPHAPRGRRCARASSCRS